jgi:uncharacterized protein YjiS (DUF1127 family)
VTSASAGQEASESFRSRMRFAQMLCVFDQPRRAGFRAPKETIMFDKFRHRFARWLAYRQTLASLRQAPDSTLADAGISREEIREHARHASLSR